MTKSKSICPRCGRTPSKVNDYPQVGRIAYFIVTHNSYGCDTGCCGHSVEGVDERGTEHRMGWFFDHPGIGQSEEEFARECVLYAVGHECDTPLRFEECQIVDD